MGPMTPAKPYLYFPDGSWFRQRPKACVLWRNRLWARGQADGLCVRTSFPLVGCASTQLASAPSPC